MTTKLMNDVQTRRDALRFLGMGVAAAALPRTVLNAAEPQFPKGAIIRTILKDLPPSALSSGATLFHEHMSLSAVYMQKMRTVNPPRAGAPVQPPLTEPYFTQDLDLMVEELMTAKKEGVACLVDGGHADMGRNLSNLRQISMRSGMPIVASTGFYIDAIYPSEVGQMTEDQIAEDLIWQANTEPLGAFGEIGISEVITPTEKKVLRAVGKAHAATNLPIFSHTAFGKSALEQLDVFESVGVKPEHLVIGHVGGLIDPEAKVQKALCKRGVFIGIDRQGGPNDTQQIPMVMAILDAGYAANLLFASDFSSPGQTKRNGGAGYAKTVTVFAPKLREAGVKEETLHGILVDNPRRFLAFVPKKHV